MLALPICGLHSNGRLVYTLGTCGEKWGKMGQICLKWNVFVYEMGQLKQMFYI